MAVSNATRRNRARRAADPTKSHRNSPAWPVLPFIDATKRPLHHWRVPQAADYSAACSVGATYAAHYLEHLKERQLAVSLLGMIARDIDYSDDARRGFWVGFFAFLEDYLARCAATGKAPGHWDLVRETVESEHELRVLFSDFPWPERFRDRVPELIARSLA